MTPFLKDLLNKLSEITRVYLVGGAVRDHLLEIQAKDTDVVTELDLSELKQILERWGYRPLMIGASTLTVSVFAEGERIDFTHLTQDMETDALRRDFTINAIYRDVRSGEFVDPLGGRKDLLEKRLCACGDPYARLREDPLRILRMVRLKVKYRLTIAEETQKAACELIETLKEVASERITEELGRILVQDPVEEGLRLLEAIGYWRVYVPEVARLQGLVQNRYHTKDAWEHTLHVVRNTPPRILLRLAGLFHDLGKWETASRECNVWGKLGASEKGFTIGDFQIMGKQLQRWSGQFVEVRGARLDFYPHKIQVKHIHKSMDKKTGFEWVFEGKRHFLGHETESVHVVRRILPRYRFSMLLGSGQAGEKELLWLIENHMSGTLTFMAELRGEGNKSHLQEKVRRFAWEKGWDGRSYQRERVYDLLDLWRADFFGGKQREAQDEENFEILQQKIRMAVDSMEQRWRDLDWTLLERFTREKNLVGKEIGLFKEQVLSTAMLNERYQPDNPAFLEKEYVKFRRGK